MSRIRCPCCGWLWYRPLPVLYLMQRDLWAFALLAGVRPDRLSDGFIARRFNQITVAGSCWIRWRISLTQVTVVICLTTRYPQVLPLTIICFVKELCQGIGGIILLRGQLRGARCQVVWQGLHGGILSVYAGDRAVEQRDARVGVLAAGQRGLRYHPVRLFRLPAYFSTDQPKGKGRPLRPCGADRERLIENNDDVYPMQETAGCGVRYPCG